MEAGAVARIQLQRLQRTIDHARLVRRLAGIRGTGIGGRRTVHLEPVGVVAHADIAAQLVIETELVGGEHADAAFGDRVVAHSAGDLTLDGVEQADLADVVVATFDADAPAAAAPLPLLRQVGAVNLSSIDLLELVAIDRVVEEIGEVRPQVQAVVDRICTGIEVAAERRPAPATGQAVPRTPAAIGGFQLAERIDQPLIHGPLRDLVRRIPRVPVAHERQVAQAAPQWRAVTQQPAGLADVLVEIGPRPVVGLHFGGIQQVARTDLAGIQQQSARIPVLADGQVGLSLRHAVGELELHRTCG